ncbi:MAG: hypothetical protein V3T77_10265 [Planctomycetota bacterium]
MSRPIEVTVATKLPGLIPIATTAVASRIAAKEIAVTSAPHPCPFCKGSLRHLKRIVLGKPVAYPIPSHYECPGCGYQEEAAPLTRRDLRKLIQDGFRRLREGGDSSDA